MNNKMGGDLKKIQVVGRYLVEIWKAVGMNMERVQFLSASGGCCYALGERVHNKQLDGYCTPPDLACCPATALWPGCRGDQQAA
jgi:hypothetical protein